MDPNTLLVPAAAHLKKLLDGVAKHVDSDFAGLGIIVWDCVVPLPTYSMRDQEPASMRDADALSVLSAVSREPSEYHDGFHVLDQSLNVIQLSTYFSPAIVPDLVLPAHARSYGGRYLAAAFGSCSPGVVCTGVLSRRYGPYVFQSGREV